ncbi:phospholipase D3 [Pelomyxa schiedti]|nr:phospholipase D3 [Pelomyxa schiedti]
MAVRSVITAVAISLCLVVPLASCQSQFEIVESIPEQVQLACETSTYDAWVWLISNAKSTILFAEYYWTLTDGMAWPAECGGYEGYDVYELIRAAHNERGVTVQIVQNQPDSSFPDDDSQKLANEGVAEVRSIDFTKLNPPIDGILHTKLIIVDGRHFYVGSANTDWRALTQVKEFGVLVRDSPELAGDLIKEFEMWWQVAKTGSIPSVWPTVVDTPYTSENPALVSFNSQPPSEVYFSMSPPQFCTAHRTHADVSTVDIINNATLYINIEVMDYQPASLYQTTNYYWPEIDDALRAASYRGVQVNLLVSLWNSTNSAMYQYVSSLDALNNITARWFIVPDMTGIDEQIPYTRVNHSKFLVTDNTVYISNNNWTADYFQTTAGVTMVVRNDPAIQQDALSRFERDWNSEYTHTLFPPTD